MATASEGFYSNLSNIKDGDRYQGRVLLYKDELQIGFFAITGIAIKDSEKIVLKFDDDEQKIKCLRSGNPNKIYIVIDKINKDDIKDMIISGSYGFFSSDLNCAATYFTKKYPENMSLTGGITINFCSIPELKAKATLFDKIKAMLR